MKLHIFRKEEGRHDRIAPGSPQVLTAAQLTCPPLLCVLCLMKLPTVHLPGQQSCSTGAWCPLWTAIANIVLLCEACSHACPLPLATRTLTCNKSQSNDHFTCVPSHTISPPEASQSSTAVSEPLISPLKGEPDHQCTDIPSAVQVRHTISTRRLLLMGISAPVLVRHISSGYLSKLSNQSASKALSSLPSPISKPWMTAPRAAPMARCILNRM